MGNCVGIRALLLLGRGMAVLLFLGLASATAYLAVRVFSVMTVVGGPYTDLWRPPIYEFLTLSWASWLFGAACLLMAAALRLAVADGLPITEIRQHFVKKLVWSGIVSLLSPTIVASLIVLALYVAWVLLE